MNQEEIIDPVYMQAYMSGYRAGREMSERDLWNCYIDFRASESIPMRIAWFFLGIKKAIILVRERWYGMEPR
jgi:hypothetical protein